ncbi:MAG: UDP-N-acetylmuramoyl-L-alanine--D-glutamate ligase [Pseudomonadota bacterium]|nr:UDP-N-acetylmuramoyl-L-alanine--D-glutamate ligase [Pseudomonadota bacterium]
MELAGKGVVVIGLAVTGLAAAEFLLRRGARVTATDVNPQTLAAAAAMGIKTAPHAPEILRGADFVVPSPGVPPTNPILVAAGRAGIPIIGELELAGRFLRPPLVAVTGTNGKTTTTALIGHILRQSGRRVFVGGNIGNPLVGYVGGPQEDDWAVVEVSSFQLQWSETFHPAVAVLLNVTPDHLDYHGGFAAYREVKERLFARQTAADTAILNGDDPETAALAPRLAARTLLFRGGGGVVAHGMHPEGETLVHVLPTGRKETYPRSMVKLPGIHNLENVMAAVLAARSCGCPREAIAPAVASFAGFPHRIEYAGERRGVSFYDDSKGTNVDAVRRALETFAAPVILLMGGRDKAGDFRPLIPLARRKVKRLVLFGEAREAIGAVLGGLVTTDSHPTLREGIAAAVAAATPGDVVLLSPGCASFDEFPDYRARGKFFQDRIKALAHD